ncbi:MAG: hypothetical protein R3C17_10830 [Planctomycetaceae bacterium]
MKTDDVSCRAAQTAAIRNPRLWNRRGVVTTSIVLCMLGAGIGLLPTAITATKLRNQLLTSAIGNEELTATSESATAGWFAPLSFRNVRVVDANGSFEWTVGQIDLSRGLFPLLTDSTQIGEIRLQDSSLRVHLNEAGEWPLKSHSRPSKTNFSFSVHNGSLELSIPSRETPIVELGNLEINGGIDTDSAGQRTLNIEPIELLNHAPLSESHTQQNLALIAPVLSQATALSGSASVWLDAIHIPLAGETATEGEAELSPEAAPAPSKFTIHGRAEFHELDARLKENWTRQVTALVGQVSGISVPGQIQVLKDSKVQFSVSKEGISHEGMMFLLPEIAQELTFTSSGMVHMDETLDLVVTLKLNAAAPTGRPFLEILAQLTENPIQLKIAGTVSEPKLQLAKGADLLSGLAGRITPAGYTEESPPLPSAVLDLIQSVGRQDREAARKDLPGNILNLIRAVDEQARVKRAERKSRRK